MRCSEKYDKLFGRECKKSAIIEEEYLESNSDGL